MRQESLQLGHYNPSFIGRNVKIEIVAILRVVAIHGKPESFLHSCFTRGFSFSFTRMEVIKNFCQDAHRPNNNAVISE